MGACYISRWDKVMIKCIGNVACQQGIETWDMVSKNVLSEIP